MEALQAALDEQMPANTIAITEDNTKLIFSAELANLDFEVKATETGAAATWTLSESAALVPLRVAGVSLLKPTSEQNRSTGVALYEGDTTVSVDPRGPIWVEIDDNITPAIGDPVFVRTVAGSTEGYGVARNDQDAADCMHEPDWEWVEAVAVTRGGVRLAPVQRK